MYNSNYRKQTKKHLVKPLVITMGVLIILSVLSLVSYKTYQHYHKINSPVSTGPTAEQKKQATNIDNAKKESVVNGGTTSSSDSVQNTTPPATSTTGTNIELSAKKETNSSVTITSKLPGVASGTCNLVVNNGSKKITKDAPVIYQPEFSTCAGFNIPISDLGTGTWTIVLNLIQGANTTSKTITFEVN